MRHRDVYASSFFLAEKQGARRSPTRTRRCWCCSPRRPPPSPTPAPTAASSARADLEALVETSPVDIVVFDANSGRPASFNREAQRIVAGLRTPDRPLEELLEVITCRRADGREISLEEFPLAQQLTSAETVRAEEMALTVPDGRSVRTLVNVTPIRAEDGQVVSVVVTMQDLAPLEELERQRAEFLGLVSHELRAPLAAIKGSAAAVLGAAPALPQTETQQFLRIIDTQADHVLGLIGDLLDTGRIEAVTLSVDAEPSEVAALVDRARNTCLSGGGRHTVHIDLPRELPRVMADRERVVQVLNNLLANAARHSPESSPNRVEAAREGAHVAVSVRDEGQGVPPQMLRQLFRKHVALTGGDAGGGLGASGLGLAICKGLVKAHGGRIRAESAGLGRGARFVFTLPVAAGAEAGAEVRPAAGPAPGNARGQPRILAVDDDPLTLRFVRDALAAAGYAVAVTAEPGELAALIRGERTQFVLLDLVLPGADGIELMATVPGLSDLPVIFISGYGRDETIARALESGAADYLVKPFSPIELTARVGVALTATEFELLRILSVNAGRVVRSESLLRQVWGTARDTGDTERVRGFVKQLRAKLGDHAAHPTWIFNERGVGYRMPRPGEQ